MRPPRQALADIVVAVADQLERDAARQEGAEGLAGGAGQLHRDRVVAAGPLCLKRLATSPDSMAPAVRSTLRIGSSIVTGSRASSAGLRQLDQLAVEHVVDRMLLPLGLVGRFLRRIGLVEDAA